MNPLAAIVVKTTGAAGVAALLGVGVVSAASPSPTPTSPASAAASPAGDRHADRQAVRRAIIESEADILGIKPEELVKDLKSGQKVSDLARDKGITKDQFAERLAAKLKPRVEALVDHRVITQARADRILDRIAHGNVPFWDGIHHRSK